MLAGEGAEIKLSGTGSFAILYENGSIHLFADAKVVGNEFIQQGFDERERSCLFAHADDHEDAAFISLAYC